VVRAEAAGEAEGSGRSREHDSDSGGGANPGQPDKPAAGRARGSS
jgi:hypothetical protein